MTADRTVNVGLIGYGLGGASFHAPFITRTPGLRLAAIVTTDPDRRRLAAERYPGALLVDNVETLLSGATSLDAVAISTPNHTHFPLARAVLEAGLHVVVDKPFAATAAQAREIEALAMRVGKLAIPFQNRRWDGDYLTLRSLMNAGRLGDVFRFESRFDRWRPIRKPGWCHRDAAERAENIVHDLATHLIDQALQLLGPVVSVFAELRRIDPNVTTSDDMFIALEHASGVQSHLGSTMSAGVPGPRYHVLGTRGAYLKHNVDVQEEQLRSGMAPDAPGFGEDPRERWGVLGTGGEQETIPTNRGDYSRFYDGVSRALRFGEAPPVSIAEVAAGLTIIEAAFSSSAERRVVAIGE